MSAAIIALPRAAVAPVVQSRRRGRLPASVRSLTAYRLDVRLKQVALQRAYAEQVKTLCYEALRRTLKNEITGLAIVESRCDGDTMIYVNGEFIEKPNKLERALLNAADDVSGGALRAAEP